METISGVAYNTYGKMKSKIKNIVEKKILQFEYIRKRWDDFNRRWNEADIDVQSDMLSLAEKLPGFSFADIWKSTDKEVQRENLSEVLDRASASMSSKIWINTNKEVQRENADILLKLLETKKDIPQYEIPMLWENTDKEVQREKLFDILSKAKNEYNMASIWESTDKEVQRENLFEILSKVNSEYIMGIIWGRTDKEVQRENLSEVLSEVKNEHYIGLIWKSTNEEIQWENVDVLHELLNKVENNMSIFEQIWEGTNSGLQSKELLNMLDKQKDNTDMLDRIWRSTDKKVQEEKLFEALALLDKDKEKDNSYIFGEIWINTDKEVQDKMLLELLDKVKDDQKLFQYVWKYTDKDIQIKRLLDVLSKSKDGEGTLELAFKYIDIDIIKENAESILKVFNLEGKKKLWLELAEKNEDILKFPPYLLEDKFIEAFGVEKVSVLSCYPDIIFSIASLANSPNGDKKIELLGKCIEGYIDDSKSEADWNNFAERILNNINSDEYSYEKLIENIDIRYIDKNTLTALNNLLIHPNIYGVENIEQVRDISSIQKAKCDALISSDKMDEKKEAVLISKFGMTLHEAEELVRKFGKDINGIEGSDIRYQVEAVSLILGLDDEIDRNVKILDTIYNDVKGVEHVNPLVIERKLKTEYAKKYNEGLFRVESGEKIEENVYEAGTDFKMIITSVAAYSPNNPENYCDDWNRKSLASPHFCASYIRNDMMGTAGIPHLCYGFNEMSDDSLVLSGSSDINSSGRSFSSTSFEETYYLPDTQINMTDTYNEMDYKRFQNGARKQPDYIVVFRADGVIRNMDEAKKASEQFKTNTEFPKTVPIVVVDVDKCLENEQRKVHEMVKSFEENPTVELAEAIAQKIHNNNMTSTNMHIKRVTSFCTDVDVNHINRVIPLVHEEHHAPSERTVTLDELIENDKEATYSSRKSAFNAIRDLVKKKPKNIENNEIMQ